MVNNGYVDTGDGWCKMTKIKCENKYCKYNKNYVCQKPSVRSSKYCQEFEPIEKTTNKETLMLGLEEYFEERTKPMMLDEAKRLNEQFATNLLSKLQMGEVIAEGTMIIPFESEGFLINGEFIGDIFHKRFGDKSIENIKIYAKVVEK